MTTKEVNETQYKKARELLREKIKLSQYIEDNKLGYVSGKGTGKINCPIHGENTPSFFYDDSIGSCNCFGCGVGGTVLELHMHYKRLSNSKYSSIQAMYDLAKTYNIEIPDLYEYIDDGRLSNKIKLRRRGEKISPEIQEDINKNYIHNSPSMFINAPVKARYYSGVIIDKYLLGEIDSTTAVDNLNKLKDALKRKVEM